MSSKVNFDFIRVLLRKSSTLIFSKNLFIPAFIFSFYYLHKSFYLKTMKLSSIQNSQNKQDPLLRSKAKMKLKNKQNIMIISGNGNLKLAEEVAERLGKKLSKVNITRKMDTEIELEVLEEPRGKDVFIIQPICNPANENLFELLLLVSALKKGSCKSLTVIIPYYGYSTFDKKDNQKIPIAAADVSRFLEIAGVDKVACIDLHSDQTEGFFSIPADNIDPKIIMIDYLINSNLIKNFNKLSILAIDANNVYRSKHFADILISRTSANISISLITKENLLGFEDDSKMHLVGDVEGKECIIIEDILNTAGSITSSADVLYKNGAKKVFVFATHAVLSGSAIEEINKSNIIKVVLTNTIPIPTEKLSDKFIILSAGTLIAEVIRRIYYNESISEIC